MKYLLICAAIVAATLSGCADVKTDVQASGASGTPDGERTYGLARTPSQDASPFHAQYEALVRDELAQYGFVARPADNARYLVSLAYETHASAIAVDTGDCAGADCRDLAPPLFSFPGQRSFVHSLTLRFFERATGHEVYKVTAASRDHDADPLHASRYLVKSALAKFPFDGQRNWRVKLRTDTADSVPGIVSVAPLER